MTIKKGDFVELDYTGMLAENGEVFDTTLESVAKEKKIHSKKNVYKAVKIIIGENQLLPGLETFLEGKQPGEYEVSLKAEQAFGLKDPKMLKLIPLKAFTSQQIQPFVGLDVNIDGQTGVVRSVNGGRIIVDFNHPLSSKDVKYKLNVKRIMIDPKEKIETWFEYINTPVEVKVEGKKANVTLKNNLPEQLIKPIQEKIKKYVDIEVEIKNTAKDEKTEQAI